MFSNSKKHLASNFEQQVQAERAANHSNGAKVRSAVVVCRNALLGSPEQSHGQSFVGVKLKKDMHSTYWIAVSANFINVLTSVPAFFFGFATLGSFGLVLTSALSGIVLKASNESAAAASSSAKGNRLWSTQGLIMFVSLNVLLSVFSGIGSELMINRSELRFILAEEMIDEQKEKLRNDPEVLAAQQECKVLEDLIARLPVNSPQRRAAYYQARGSFGSSAEDYISESDASVPKCFLAERKQQEFETRYAHLEEKLSQQDDQSDLEFLEETFPDVYETNFKSDGSVKSEAEEFRLAAKSFYSQLLSIDFSNASQFGFSLFIALLSVITSSGACLLLLAHICRKDTGLSYNLRVKDAMERHLVYLEKVLIRGPQLELEDDTLLSPLPIVAEEFQSPLDDENSKSRSSDETKDKFNSADLKTPQAKSAIATHLTYLERSLSSNPTDNVLPFPPATNPVQNTTATPPTKENITNHQERKRTDGNRTATNRTKAKHPKKQPFTDEYHKPRP